MHFGWLHGDPWLVELILGYIIYTSSVNQPYIKNNKIIILPF